MERLPTPPGERPDESDASPESAYTATATINEQGIVTGWSEGARRLLGYVPSEVVGQPAARLLADDVGETAAAGCGRAGEVERHRGAAAPGRPPAGAATARAPPDAGRPGPEWLVVSAVAGEPRTPGSEALREWGFGQSPCVLAVFDADLRLVRANAGMERALSLTEEQMRGLRLPEIAPHPVSDEAEKKMRLALETGEPQHVEACSAPRVSSASTAGRPRSPR